MQRLSCVTRNGFRVGVHHPSYAVDNLRMNTHVESLGRLSDGTEVDNHRNYPTGPVEVVQASKIFEIPNALPFKGTTYIDSSWAAAKAGDPLSIGLPKPAPVSMTETFGKWGQNISDEKQRGALFQALPRPVLLTLAVTSTDERDLTTMSRLACDLIDDQKPLTGLSYQKDERGRTIPVILDHDLFEALGNNPALPDELKTIMVLKPGAQGGSEIVGEWGGRGEKIHIYEYLRRNSYIPFGHYAANMAEDAVRYQIGRLLLEDMEGLRHLYAQRTFVRLAQMVGVSVSEGYFSEEALDVLRLKIIKKLESQPEFKLPFTATLWGWNFGFDFSPTGYRLHASHQQIHQQYALIPQQVGTATPNDESFPSFACGDMVAEWCMAYQQATGRSFFEDYVECLRTNRRTDGKDGESRVIVWEDDNVVLFVPKAQTSQWELQLMTLMPVGNILEANLSCRRSLNRGIHLALRILEDLGARMVTNIEYSKRFDNLDTDQRLLYAFLPKLPWSPGGFSEAQLRWIIGHYPEDFAFACRAKMEEIERKSRG